MSADTFVSGLAADEAISDKISSSDSDVSDLNSPDKTIESDKSPDEKIAAYFDDPENFIKVNKWKSQVKMVRSCGNAFLFQQGDGSGRFFWREKRTVALNDDLSIIIARTKYNQDIPVLNMGTDKFEYLATLNSITGYDNLNVPARFDYEHMDYFLGKLDAEGFFALNDGASGTKEAYFSAKGCALLEIIPSTVPFYERFKMSCLDVTLPATVFQFVKLED